MASLAETSATSRARGRRPLRYVGDDREGGQQDYRHENGAARAQGDILHGLDLFSHGAVGYHPIPEVGQPVDMIYAAELVDGNYHHYGHQIGGQRLPRDVGRRRKIAPRARPTRGNT